ncbi:DUF6151 family protein [Aquincola sp. MAHUQ-54]|uniref:DUF6151 family protein n=1 Tax=Aquincola agrisoli TaxID=3119538 RepID=A0AAW9QLK9_9BURK
MELALQCRCGALRGLVSHPAQATRAVCYCRHCQAYARLLGDAASVLDAQGGTTIVATLPGHVRFTQGADRLACMSLTHKGPLRWFSSCCRTPIANTAREMKLPYAGLVHTCLRDAGGTLPAAYGPVRAQLNTGSATGPVAHSPWRNLLAMGRLMRIIGGGRLRGAWRATPFFTAEGEPVAPPQAPPASGPGITV